MHLIWVCTVYLSLFLSYSEVSISPGSALFEYRQQLLVSSVDNFAISLDPDQASMKRRERYGSKLFDMDV